MRLLLRPQRTLDAAPKKLAAPEAVGSIETAAAGTKGTAIGLNAAKSVWHLYPNAPPKAVRPIPAPFQLLNTTRATAKMGPVAASLVFARNLYEQTFPS